MCLMHCTVHLQLNTVYAFKKKRKKKHKLVAKLTRAHHVLPTVMVPRFFVLWSELLR